MNLKRFLVDGILFTVFIIGLYPVIKGAIPVGYYIPEIVTGGLYGWVRSLIKIGTRA